MSHDRRIVIGVTSAGSLRFYAAHISALLSKGWSVHAVSSPGPHLEALREAGASVHAIEMKRAPSVIKDLVALWRWSRLLRNVRPSHLLVGTPKASLLALLAGWFNRAPFRVYHLLGLRLETTRGVARLLLAISEGLTHRLATHTVAVSFSLREAYLREIPRLARDVIVIGAGTSGGVDTKRFTRTTDVCDAAKGVSDTLQLVPGVATVGFIGRLVRDKGISTLIEAVRLLEGRGRQIQLLLVGGEEEILPSSLASITSRVLRVGRVSDVRPYLAVMDVLCLPTLREGFPNVVLEASSMEVPVVTTTATGAVDSVIDGETGLAVRPGDPAALARALTALLDDSDLAEIYGRNGRSRVVAEFDQERVVEQHIDFLESLHCDLRRRRSNR